MGSFDIANNPPQAARNVVFTSYHTMARRWLQPHTTTQNTSQHEGPWQLDTSEYLARDATSGVLKRGLGRRVSLPASRVLFLFLSFSFSFF
jgi:hypothetical protein